MPDRPIRYGGDDLDALEARVKTFSPNRLACDPRPMMQRDQADGAVASSDDLARTTALWGGRAPRSPHACATAAAREQAAA